jgi:putative transposase
LAKSKTSSFITEIPLVVDSKQQKELRSRSSAARQLYNACLNEAMVRMNLVRNSEAFQQAKQINREVKKKRSDAFNAARKAYRYSDYDMQAYATIVSNRSSD